MHSTLHLQFVWQLYYCSHSLLMFAEVFGLVWPLKRHRMLELLGWAPHFLIDIPTHQGIFANHFPWADSSLDSMAFAGENGLFPALNYSVRTSDLTYLWMLARR